MSQPSRILELSTTKEKDNVQQYVEVGSNIFLGTKDGMKYTLIQTQDNKYRLVETVSALSADSEGSFETSLKDDDASVVIENAMSSGGHKAIKLTPLKFEPSPCQGQGDEIENPILTSCSISDFKESDISLENVSAAKDEDDIDSAPQLTYTTLLPRQEKEHAVSSICYSTPSSSYYSSPPIFSTPISTRCTRSIKKQKIQLIPVGASYSPIPRLRVDGPKQRRPRHPMFQYTPHTSHSSIRSSNVSESEFSVTASSSSDFSDRSFSRSQSSFEIPRVPNNTPTSPEDDVLDKQKALNMQWMPQIVNRVEEYIGLDPRESHNEKERKRRLRIKNACQFMRTLLPCISEKTDNATVFERAANYIAFIRDTVGSELDMEFIEHNYIF